MSETTRGFVAGAVFRPGEVAESSELPIPAETPQGLKHSFESFPPVELHSFFKEEEAGPFLNDQVPVAVVLDGRIWNASELRAELQAEEFPVEGPTEAEIVAKAFLCWGEEAFLRIEGAYSFALWDDRSRRAVVYLVRDRLGLVPLRYQIRQGRLRFSTESGPHEVEEVFLPAGKFLRFENALGTEVHYWDFLEVLSEPFLGPLEGEEWVAALDGVLARCCMRQIPSFLGASGSGAAEGGRGSSDGRIAIIDDGSFSTRALSLAMSKALRSLGEVPERRLTSRADDSCTRVLSATGARALWLSEPGQERRTWALRLSTFVPFLSPSVPRSVSGGIPWGDWSARDQVLQLALRGAVTDQAQEEYRVWGNRLGLPYLDTEFLEFVREVPLQLRRRERLVRQWISGN